MTNSSEGDTSIVRMRLIAFFLLLNHFNFYNECQHMRVNISFLNLGGTLKLILLLFVYGKLSDSGNAEEAKMT